MPPEPSYLVGRYGEIENEIDNLDNLDEIIVNTLQTQTPVKHFTSPGGVADI